MEPPARRCIWSCPPPSPTRPVAGDLVEALVLAGRRDEATETVEQLRRLSLEQDHPWGSVTVQRGEALIRLSSAGDYDEERCGAAGWAAQAREEPEVSGRRSRPDDQLTPTEQRVVDLAADGLANRDIARQLFVSVKTVEGNLSRAYSKLGLRSRGELVRRLRDRTRP